MPTTTITILDRVEKTLGGISDYRAAKELGVTQQTVSLWRAQRYIMSDKPAIRAAQILGERPEALMSMLAADRTSDEHAKKLWTNLARRLQRSAAAIAMLSLGITAFHSDDAHASMSPHFVGMYIMSNIEAGTLGSRAARRECPHSIASRNW